MGGCPYPTRLAWFEVLSVPADGESVRGDIGPAQQRIAGVESHVTLLHTYRDMGVSGPLANWNPLHDAAIDPIEATGGVTRRLDADRPLDRGAASRRDRPSEDHHDWVRDAHQHAIGRKEGGNTTAAGLDC